jgi:hypothetical protein
MSKSIVSTAVAGALLALGSHAAMAAPDWSKVPKRDVHVFHAGVTPIEWATKKSDHSGSAGMRKGETCAGCHEEKGALNFNFKRLADKELEPKGAPKTMTFPVSTQVAYDAANLYIRLTFKARPAAPTRATRTTKSRPRCCSPTPRCRRPTSTVAGRAAMPMPAPCRAPTTKKTKYTKEGAYELVQWASKGNKVSDGSVTTERKMSGGGTGAKAEGGKSGDTYTSPSRARIRAKARAFPSASRSTPTTRTAASITSRSATRWASAPMAT